VKRIYGLLTVLAVLALMLTACSPIPAVQAPAATTQAPAATTQAPPATSVDIAQLGSNVDVATVKTLLGRDDVLILDVREPSEYDAGHIPGVKLIPMATVANRLNEIPKDKPVLVTCRSGNRSGQVTEFLRQQGYTNVHNMTGGIAAWQQAGYPVEK